MGTLLREFIDDWASGVVTSTERDQAPLNAYVRGYNCALARIGAGKAVVTKRLGCKVINSTPITGSTAVVGQHEFRKLSGGAFTPYHVAVSDSGRLDTIATGGTVTTIDASAFTASTTQSLLPCFADANNLCFITNGTDAKKFTGTAAQTFGIVAPLTAPTLTDSGSAGSHNGTYEGFVTFANSATGHESSPGPTSGTVTVANKTILWSSVEVSTDTQVDTRYLYIRNTSTQGNFYYAGTIANNSATTQTTTVADSALTVLAPLSGENDPPPTGTRYVAWHRSRMFAATDTTVYYSKERLPEAFDADNYEPVNPNDGQRITGMVSVFDLLVVFKSRAMYALVGFDPATWTMQLIDGSVGCAAHRSIIVAGGRLWWWSDQGPATWAGSGPATLLGPPFIADTIATDTLSSDVTTIGKIVGEHDLSTNRLLWGVPSLSQTRNTVILPFNYRVNRWESDGWDPLDVASMAVVRDALSRPFVVFGGYAGQVFRYGDATADGVRAGTTDHGTFVASGTSVTTITDLTATFDTTGGGLVERKVTLCDSAGAMVGSTRRRIASNTATTATLATTIYGLTNGATYTYYIGGPAFDWESGWHVLGDAYMKKRFRFLFLSMRVSSGTSMRINTYFDGDLSTTYTRTASFADTLNAGEWDVSQWDAALWDAAGLVPKRLRVGHTGTAIMVRLQNYAANANATLLKFGLEAEALSTKIDT